MYNSNATPNLNFQVHALSLWRQALPGQWFICVLNTDTRNLYIEAVNVFDAGNGRLSDGALNNTSGRAMNRYASGAVGERNGISMMNRHMKSRDPRIPHHQYIVNSYGLSISDCVGFTIIKTTDNFALIKFTSASLNTDKPRSYVNHSFSMATALKQTGFIPGGAQVPKVWQEAIINFFKTSRFNINHIAVSND